jgi:hypothetical protein
MSPPAHTFLEDVPAGAHVPQNVPTGAYFPRNIPACAQVSQDHPHRRTFPEGLRTSAEVCALGNSPPAVRVRLYRPLSMEMFEGVGL